MSDQQFVACRHAVGAANLPARSIEHYRAKGWTPVDEIDDAPNSAGEADPTDPEATADTPEPTRSRRRTATTDPKE